MVLVESAQHFVAGLVVGHLQDVGDLVGVEAAHELLQVVALHALDERLLERPGKQKEHFPLAGPGQLQEFVCRGIGGRNGLLDLCEVVHGCPLPFKRMSIIAG